ncbi:reverse transcriptase domain-containing protein [Tanacetum coccineum]|uniref:Reverse transcriptase domain-containing protein n=1 Tax=Tanacetum coccineum TaxID=301880 RepID=A0ABQ4XXK4_9ASTR
MDAMTIKMDALYKELQSRAKQPTLDLDDDDMSMSREEEFDRLADKQFGRPSGSLPCNTQPNPRGGNSKAYQPPQSYNEHVNAIFIRSGKSYDLPAVRINVPLVDVLARMPNYDKFLKELISNKHKNKQIFVAFLSDESSAMIQNKVPPKLKDLESFLIPCNFNKTFSCNALADLGASINLIPYSLYAKLSLETLKPTKMSVRLADRSFQYPVAIAENMLIEVGKFTFPTDFVILEMEEDIVSPMTSGMVLDLRGGGGDAIPQGIHVDRKDYIIGGDALPILVLGLLSLQIYYNRYFPASEHNDIGESMGRYVSRIRENSGSTMEKFTRWLFCWSNWEDCPLGKPNISMAKEDQSVEHRGRQDRGYDSKRQDFRGQDQRFTGRNGNDRQGQGQRRSTETLPPPPLCTTCGKPHPGVCYKATGGCFTCGSTQHKVKDCPQGKQKQSMPRVLLDTSYYMTVLSTTRDQAAKTSEFADVYFPMNFQASANGIIIDHQRFEANTKWPRPTTVTEVEFEEIETRLVSAPILTLPSEFRREVVELLKDYDKHPVPSRARLCVAGALSQKSVDEACFDSIILHELERLDVELCVRGLRKLGELVLSSYSIFILKPMVRSERTIQTLEIFEGCVLWNGQAHQRSLMRKWLVLREIGNEARSRQKSYADKHRRDLEFQVGDRGISEGFAIQEELNDLDKGQAQSSDSTVPFENIGTYLRGFVSSGSSTHLSATFRCLS